VDTKSAYNSLRQGQALLTRQGRPPRRMDGPTTSQCQQTRAGFPDCMVVVGTSYHKDNTRTGSTQSLNQNPLQQWIQLLQQHFYWRPMYIAGSKEHLTNYFSIHKSAFSKTYWLKLLLKFVNFSRSYARTRKPTQPKRTENDALARPPQTLSLSHVNLY